MDNRKKVEALPLALERDATLPALLGMAGITAVALAAAQLLPLVLGT